MTARTMLGEYRARLIEEFRHTEPVAVKIPALARSALSAFALAALLLWGSPASAQVMCNGVLATIVGTEGDDDIDGTSGDDVIAGLGGDDEIRGRGGNDIICAGPGDDHVRGEDGNDLIFGEDGDDDLEGGKDNDVVDGGLGHDSIRGDDDWDTCRNGADYKDCETIAPQADAGPDQTAAIGATVVLDGGGTTDFDDERLSFAWSLTQLPAGSAAVLSDPSSVNPTFVADLSGTYVAQLVANDGGVDSDPDTVTIDTDDSAPKAEAGPNQKAETGQTIHLDGSGSSDFDGDELQFSWDLTSVPEYSTATLSGATDIDPSFQIDEEGTYRAELTVNDGVSGSVADAVTIRTGDTPGVADAGPDQTASVGQTIWFDASTSYDLDGGHIEPEWSLIAAPSASSAYLDETDDVNAELPVDAPGTYVVQLRVEGSGSDDGDTVVVRTDNSRPVADAGPDQSVAAGASVQLDGAGINDVDGDLLALNWHLTVKPSGSTAALDDSASLNPSFVADLAGSYVVQLSVNDGALGSAPDTVLVGTANVRPVAGAGPDQTVPVGATVQLDGAASADANSDPLSHAWSISFYPDYSTAELSSAVIVNPTFVADLAGIYVAQLIVNDGALNSAPDTIVISTINSRPVANGGPDQSVSEGDVVQLDATGSSDADGDALSYRWAITVKPAGGTATLSDPAAVNPSFTADKFGVYLVQLIVNDGQFDSAPDTLTVSTPNQPPVAGAGPDQVVRTNSAVQLDGGASSDADGDALTFAWQFTATPAGSTAVLANAGAAQPSFVADLAGDFTVQLIVNDGTVDSAPDTIIIASDPTPPVAEAGPDQTKTAGETAILDGGGSTDAELRPLTFAWQLIARPAGSAAILTGAATQTPSLTTDLVGLYIAELVVNDGASDSVADNMAVRALGAAVNTPPVLDPIGDQTIALGSTLTFTVTGSDADGEALLFSAAPVPLPAGASLDAVSGVFIFTPDIAQVGDIVLTFTVDDGRASVSETIVITVTGAPVGGITAVTGQVFDAVAWAAGQSVPVAGATVSLISDPGTTTTTDSTGGFTLSGVADGVQVVNIDATTAGAAPDGSAYASTSDEVSLIADVTNIRPDPFFVTRIDAASATIIDPAVTTTVTNSALNVSLDVPANSAMLGGNLYTGQLSISGIPSSHPGSVLPNLIFPCQMYTVQPAGVTFATAAPVTFPNLDNLADGTDVDIWGLDPATGLFAKIGLGRVSAGGSDIATITGGLLDASAFFAAPHRAISMAAADENSVNKTPTALVDGNFSTSVSLASYRSLGVSRGPTLIYNSTAADPRPIIAAEIMLPFNTGVPGVIETRLEVGGVAVAGPIYTRTDLADDPNGGPLGVGETVRLAISFDASQFPTGSYSYSLVSTSDFGCSRIGGVTKGNVLINNQSDSPLGKGWTVAGIQRLTVTDAAAVIANGDGTIQRFARQPTGINFSVPIAFPQTRPGAFAIDDLDGDGNLDLAALNILDGLLDLHFGDGAGDFPDKITLPTGDPGVSGDVFFDTVAVATGDFNGDGIRDIAVANQLSVKVQVHLSTGPRSYDPAPLILGGFLASKPESVAVADFNGDGNDDIAVGTIGSKLYLFRGDGTGGFSTPGTVTGGVGTDANDLALADFNNDGIVDIAALASGNSNDKAYLLINDGAGGFTVNPSVNTIRVKMSTSSYKVAAADFDGDGNTDIAAANALTTGLTVTLFRGDGAGGLINPTTISPGFAETNSVQFADLNKDGLPDLIAADRLQPRVSVLLNDGAGGFAAPVLFDLPGAGGTIALLVADIDKDGGLDIVAVGGGGFIYLLLADPSGNLEFASPQADFSTLTENPDGTFTRAARDGTQFVFDAQGQQIAVIDRNNNTTAYAYDAQGRIATVTGPAGLVTAYTYGGPGGELSLIAGPAGRNTVITFDADGNIANVTAPDDYLTRYSYDTSSRMTAMASLRGFVQTMDYGSAGQYLGGAFPDGASIAADISRDLGLADLGLGLGNQANPLPFARPGDQTASFTDGNGNVTSFKLNAFGSPVEVTDAIGRVTTLDRDADNQVTRITAPSDGELADGSVPGTVVSEFDYDANGNVTARREAVGTWTERETLFVYEPVFNNVILITDPAGNSTSFAYDGLGNLTTRTDALGGERVFTYDVRGRRLTARDANFNTTAFAYNADSNLATILDAAGNTIALAYDSAGNVISRIDGQGAPEERSTSFTYDPLNRKLTETDGNGATTSFTYDANGNPVATTDATGLSATASYDERGRLIEDNDPVTDLVTQTFDANGNLATVTNALGNTTSFFYDAVNRVEKITDTLLNDRVFEYDADNQLKRVQDARNNVTTFAHDLLRRQIRRSNPAGQNWEFAYDSRNNRVQVTNPKGETINNEFDALSRLVTVTTIETDGTTVEDTTTYSHDAEGNLLSAADSDSNLAFTIDALNRLSTTATVVAAGTVQPAVLLSNEFDAVGQRITLKHGPDSLTVDGTWTYDYDNTGRLTGLVSPANDNVNPGYDGAGRIESIDFSNTVISQFAYGPNGRVQRIDHSRGATELLSFDYSYFDDGLVSSIIEPNGTRNFTYDVLRQLTSGGFAANPETYSYDEEGNRIASHLSTGHISDATNRLTEDDSFCYAYDANGSLQTKTEKVAGLCTGDQTNYVWDVRRHLVQIDFPDLTSAIYRYDALGRRIEKTAGGIVTRYVYYGSDIVLEYDGADTLIARYSHGLGIDQPLVMERGGQSYFYHTDHLGSIRTVTDAAGAPVNSYDYDSFGRLEAETESVVNPYKFTAREFDGESGLYYNRARYYDPETGRFLIEDPLGFDAGDINLYRYATNDPVNFTDPLGLAPASETGALSKNAVRTAPAQASIGTSVACMFANVAGLVEAASAIVTGDLVGIVDGVTGIGSCGGAKVTLLFRSRSSAKAPLIKVSGFLERPGKGYLDKIKNPKLRNIVGDLFKGKSRVGNGSSMDALVSETLTGVRLSKTGHRTKLLESQNGLRKALDKQNLTIGEREIVKGLLGDIAKTLAKF